VTGPWRDDAACVDRSTLRLAGYVAGMERDNGHDLVIEVAHAIGAAWLRCAKCGGHWDIADRRRDYECRAEGPLPPWPGIYAESVHGPAHQVDSHADDPGEPGGNAGLVPAGVCDLDDLAGTDRDTAGADQELVPGVDQRRG